MAAALTRGVLFVHSAPRALCPHIEWAASRVLCVSVRMDWCPQPAAPGLSRAEFRWEGRPGLGAELASSLRVFDRMRYEVTEDPSHSDDGGRWSHTPELGIFYCATDAAGNLVIPEDRIRSALAGDPRYLASALHLALGTAWDDELEPFRYAGDGAPVRWLERVS